MVTKASTASNFASKASLVRDVSAKLESNEQDDS